MHRLARLLKIDRMHAVGLALTWLAWLDEQTVDGCSGLTPEELDGMLGMQGVADALRAIGWCEIDEAGEVRAVDWEQYNGETAKQRALSARRMARKRLRSSYDKSVTDALPRESVTDALPREEKNIVSYHMPPARVREEGCDEGAMPSVDEVRAVMEMPDLRDDALASCAESFLLTMQARGWVDARGLPVQDWRAAARLYAKTYAENKARDAARDAARQRVADERTALIAKDVNSKVAERQQRMDPTLRPKMDCNYGARYDM